MYIQFESISMDPSLQPRGEEQVGMTRLKPVTFPQTKVLPSSATSLSIGLQCHCRESLPSFPPHRYFLHGYQIYLAIFSLDFYQSSASAPIEYVFLLSMKPKERQKNQCLSYRSRLVAFFFTHSILERIAGNRSITLLPISFS